MPFIGKNNTAAPRSLSELVRTRSSVRSYHRRPIESDVMDRLQAYLRLILEGPRFSEANLRLTFMDAAQINQEQGAKLGTYGVIRGTNRFLVPAVGQEELGFEQLGFVMEYVVLFATSLGLGTCWLGGTFNRSEFGKAIGLREGETIPAIIAFGYPKDGLDLIGAFLRMAAGSKSRKPWSELFFDSSFRIALSPEAAGAAEHPLVMVRLAPSGSNKQPWRIVRDPGVGAYHFYLQHNAGYGGARGFDPQRIDIGIAMCHWQAAVEELGRSGRWEQLSVHPLSDGSVPAHAEYVISWMTDR